MNKIVVNRVIYPKKKNNINYFELCDKNITISK